MRLWKFTHLEWLKSFSHCLSVRLGICIRTKITPSQEQNHWPKRRCQELQVCFHILLQILSWIHQAGVQECVFHRNHNIHMRAYRKHLSLLFCSVWIVPHPRKQEFPKFFALEDSSLSLQPEVTFLGKVQCFYRPPHFWDQPSLKDLKRPCYRSLYLYCQMNTAD